jgi:hypothetical protein
MKHLAKALRRERRKREKRSRRDRWQMTVHESDWPVGPNIVSATPEEVMSAMEELPEELTWDVVGPLLVPLFERVRPYPPGVPPPLQAIVPPGVPIGFGVDIGPAFITVSQSLAEGWKTSPADLAARAMANLHAFAAEVSAEEVVDGPVGDIDVAGLQTQRGIGSALVLAPSELGRIFGTQPRCFIAPMRDLLIGLPADVDPALAAWLYAEIASQDPNCLHPRLFTFDGRAVAVDALPVAQW